ncbi:hypothetical protein AB0F88_17735 [Streptosporangium sp. NPDC023963]|uniref:hypothetical protein n=1 Tax=Streptosporangium sp. NPDC023963 TaxID=3155608 RepID=UPI0034251E9D
MSTQTVLTVVSWGLLGVACVMAVQGVYLLVTGRFPPLSTKGERAFPARTHAWTLLASALACVAMALPRLLDWPAEALIVCLGLAIALLAGVAVVRRKATKEAGSTGARDRAA